MGIFASFGIGIIFAFILMVIIGGFLMWVAAKIARVEKSSFGRAMVAAIATSFVAVLALVSLQARSRSRQSVRLHRRARHLAILVIKAVFGTSFGKALVVWIFNLVAAGSRSSSPR